MVLRQKVLIIADDRNYCGYLMDLLLTHDYEPLVAHTGEDGLKMILSHCPEVVLLDVELPDMDGMAILSSVRKWSTMPMMVVSGCMEETRIVAALDMGADDYIVKPCGEEELLARIRVALRHTRTASQNIELANEGILTLGHLKIDYNRLRVYLNEEDVNLTMSEYRLVSLLGRYAGQILSYEKIIKELWGPNARGDNQILRVNMTNIRKKLEEDPNHPKYITTEKGVGYRMVTKEELE